MANEKVRPRVITRRKGRPKRPVGRDVIGPQPTVSSSKEEMRRILVEAVQNTAALQRRNRKAKTCRQGKRVPSSQP